MRLHPTNVSVLCHLQRLKRGIWLCFGKGRCPAALLDWFAFKHKPSKAMTIRLLGPRARDSSMASMCSSRDRERERSADKGTHWYSYICVFFVDVYFNLHTMCTMDENGISTNLCLSVLFYFSKTRIIFLWHLSRFASKWKCSSKWHSCLCLLLGHFECLQMRLKTRRGQGSKVKVDTEQEGQEEDGKNDKMQTKSSLELPRGASAACSTLENFSSEPLYKTQVLVSESMTWEGRCCFLGKMSTDPMNGSANSIHQQHATGLVPVKHTPRMSVEREQRPCKQRIE